EGVTIRQVARISAGGGRIRIVLSNEYGNAPLAIGAGSVALAGQNGALAALAVSLYLPEKTALSSVHWDGAQTAYISARGDFTAAPTFAADSTLKQRLFLSGIEVEAKPGARAIVFFGDSIT